jgi:geranylgeranyl pyrophosphate synthase
MLSEIELDSLSKAPDIGALLTKLDAKLVGLVCGNSDIPSMSPQPDAAQAALYHLQAGGERIRGRCAMHAGLALGLSEPDALCLAASAELLHNASLVHDDLQDQDGMRRGAPAVWKKYGSNVAICTGDLMLSAAYAALCGLSDSRYTPALVSLVHERTSLAVRGQCADLMAGQQSSVSVDAYINIAAAKSGALLSLPLELALIAAGRNTWTLQARAAAEAFATAYQIADDLSDVLMDRESGSMNIIFVLEAAGHGPESTSFARALGSQQIDKALALSLSIPCDAGSVLAESALKLRRIFATGKKQ